jgi:hypothetical protein
MYIKIFLEAGTGLCDPTKYADPTVFTSKHSTFHATSNQKDIYTPIHNAVRLQCSQTDPCNKRSQIVYDTRSTHSRNRDKTHYFNESSYKFPLTFLSVWARKAESRPVK